MRTQTKVAERPDARATERMQPRGLSADEARARVDAMERAWVQKLADERREAIAAAKRTS